jgi:hypothetical protein
MDFSVNINGKVVKMETIPECDFCSKPCEYDAKTRFGGSWAWMCKEHWVEYRASEEVGLGIGQKIEQEEIK